MVNISSIKKMVMGSAQSDASKLKALRDERLKYESRVKLQQARENEERRIAKAKSDLRKNSKVGKVFRGIATGLKEVKKEIDSNKKKNNPWR